MSRIDGLRRNINALREGSVIRSLRITASDGKTYNTRDRLYGSDFDKQIKALGGLDEKEGKA